MRLVDTSAWIEWLIASPTGKIIAPLMPAREDWLVPAIVELELAKWLTRELSEDKTDQVIAFTQMCLIAPSIRRSLWRLQRFASSKNLRLPTQLFTRLHWNMTQNF